MILLRVLRRLRARREGGSSGTPGPSQPGARRQGTLRLVRHQAKFDLLAFFRNRQARFFTLILPVLFLVIFVSVFGIYTPRDEQLAVFRLDGGTPERVPVEVMPAPSRTRRQNPWRPADS